MYADIPTVEQILEVYKSSELILDNPDNEKLKNMLLWYMDRYLPIAAGLDYWGENQRLYKLLTDKVNINGKQKVLVTVTNEAFGLLVLENCREKWIEINKFKEMHGEGAKIPEKGEEAEPFKAKWTDSKCGQVKFGGWADEAYERFEELKAALKKIRADDEANDLATQKYVYTWLRTKHGITALAPGRKSLKRSAKALPKEPKKRLLTVDSEDEDEDWEEQAEAAS